MDNYQFFLRIRFTFFLFTGMLLALFAAVALSTPTAYADERSFTDEVPLQRTNWQEQLTIPLFDPALGILTKIEFVLTGHVSGTAQLENLDAAPALVTAESVADVVLERPDGTFIVMTSPFAAQSVQLAAFDGTVDFDGPSGQTIDDIVGIEISERIAYTTAADLQLFTGLGSIDLSTTTTGRSRATGAGNLGLSFNTFAGAAVTVTYHFTQPAIALEKATNGQDADQLPGPTIFHGDVVTWTYVATNIGGVPLIDITLFDDQEGDVTTSCPQTTLAVNESMTCFVTGVAQQGQYTNTAIVTGNVPDSLPGEPRQVTATDPSHYTGIGDPAIDLEKLTNGEDADTLPGPLVAAGGVVTWTYLVQNTGEIALQAITLIDDVEGDVTATCPQTTLAVGEAMICTLTGIAQQGQYTNTATVTGVTPPDSVRPNTPVTDQDPSHYTGIGDPAIDLEKLTNGEDADTLPGPLVAAGGVVTWTYLVQNTGEIALQAITLIDDVEGDVTATCPQTTLAVGEAMICTLTGIAQQGQYTNTATVTGVTPPDSVRPNTPVTDQDPSHYTGIGDPAIDLEKLTNGEDADTLPGPLVAAGGVVTWTYLVQNTGEIALQAITLIDDVEGDVTATCPQTTLAVGEAMVCTLAGIAQQGQYTNTAIVTGMTPPDSLLPNVTVSDQDPSHYVGTVSPICPVDTAGVPILPEVTYLGEGPGEYRLADDQEQFVIKKFRPFRFENRDRPRYVSTKRNGYPERVWACTGDCTFTRGLTEVIDLGFLPGGTKLFLIMLDDDEDSRVNTLVADGEFDSPIYRFDGSSLTRYEEVELPRSASWSINIADSIGLYYCVAP